MSQEKIIVPKGWKEVKLSDKEYFLDIIGGGTPSRSNSEYFGGGIPWVRLADMKQKYISNTNETLTKKGLEKGSTLIPKNTIILSTRASIGKVAIAETELCTNQGFKSIVCDNEKVLPEFFYYFLVSIKSQLQRLGGATTFAEVNRTKLSNISVPIPPLPIQKQIVAKLDHILGQLEEKKKQILTIIENNKQRIDFFEKNWQRFLINKEIENHPQRKNWSLKKLSQVTISHDGKRIPLNKSQRSEIPGQYAYYGASGQVDSINDYKFDGKFMLLAEDGENLNTQKKPIAFIVEGKFWVNNHAHVLQTNSELNLDFLCYYMNSLNIMQFAKKQSTRPKLNKRDMNEIPVLLPSLETQKQIIQNIKSAEEKFQSQKEQFQNIKDSYESTIKYIEHMQSSILDAAFSGKLVQ